MITNAWGWQAPIVGRGLTAMIQPQTRDYATFSRLSNSTFQLSPLLRSSRPILSFLSLRRVKSIRKAWSFSFSFAFRPLPGPSKVTFFSPPLSPHPIYHHIYHTT